MATLKDLHILPRVSDRLSYLYVEHCRIDQEAKAISIQDAIGKTPVPCAALSVLMMGPGTTITHAATRALAENGCLAIWSGEEGVRMYAQGMGETRSSRNLLKQVELWADENSRLEVVCRMYRMRFDEELAPDLSIRQIRGKEGIRVREAYGNASRLTGVTWRGRAYKRGQWATNDPVNRAISAANSCLYGICHAAIVSSGYSTAIGFIHTGKMLSFVYDIADLYKVDLTIPMAFRVAAQGSHDIESRIRKECRDVFHRHRLLQRIVPDIHFALGIAGRRPTHTALVDLDPGLPGGIWDPFEGELEGGVNRGEESSWEESP